MSDLRVELQNFEGPLDLLLHLVQQDEVDIHEVPLARLADQFLEAIRGKVQDLDVDRAGEFLVMASQLLVLKSSSLLPRDVPVDLEEIDPRLDLVRQLIEYRDFKRRADALDHRAEEQTLKHQIRIQGPDRRALSADQPLEVDLLKLVEAFQRLMRETGGDHAVAMPKERLPITHYVGTIFDQLTQMGGKLGFRELIGGKPERTYVIGAFLALLELMKLRKIRVSQDGLGEIQVELRAEALEDVEAGQEGVAEVLDHVEIEEAEGGPRIVFMGSPEIAVPALNSLVGAGLRPRLVVTPPPQPTGRGRRVKQVAVARAAEDLEIPLHRTGDVNGRSSRAEIEAVEPDVLITMGFGQKLGSALLSMPKRGCINVHVSLLPKYRGASPIAAALRAGETETGVTLFQMTEGMDKGPILASARLAIDPDENLDELSKRMGELGADLLVRRLPDYIEGKATLTEQDHGQATYVGRLEKKDGVIDFAQPARQVHDFIRSVTSWPGAQTSWQPKVKHDPLPLLITRTTLPEAEAAESEALSVPAAVTEAAVAEGSAAESPAATAEARPEATTSDATTSEAVTAPELSADVGTPGTVVKVTKKWIDVQCAPGVLRILRVRPAGGRDMDVKAFLNSRRVVAGDRFLKPRKK